MQAAARHVMVCLPDREVVPLDGLLKRFLRLNAPLFAAWLQGAAAQLEQLIPGAPTAGVVWFLQPEGVPVADSITVKDNDEARSCTVSFVDVKGAPTQPDTTPVWTTSDPNVATVEASEDGQSAVVSFGLPGASTVDVETTDTDGTVVRAQGTVTVQPSGAVFGSVNFDEPAAQPGEPPAEPPPAGPPPATPTPEG